MEVELIPLISEFLHILWTNLHSLVTRHTHPSVLSNPFSIRIPIWGAQWSRANSAIRSRGLVWTWACVPRALHRRCPTRCLGQIQLWQLHKGWSKERQVMFIWSVSFLTRTCIVISLSTSWIWVGISWSHASVIWSTNPLAEDCTKRLFFYFKSRVRCSSSPVKRELYFRKYGSHNPALPPPLIAFRRKEVISEYGKQTVVVWVFFESTARGKDLLEYVVN